MPPLAYQIKITLKNIRPPIWRRLLVSEKTTLAELHNIIQWSFGWYDCHLHEFDIQDTRYGNPADDEFNESNFHDENKARMNKLGLYQGSRFMYLYDFGDSWEHEVVIEKIIQVEKGTQLPQCITGKRACPPEDVGGPWGYEEFLETINDPESSEYEETLEWIGGEFDPEAFNLQEINERLQARSARSRNFPVVVDEPDAQPCNPDQWKPPATEENTKAAQSAWLVKDAIILLNYLRETKVTGTQSTGNLPRRAVKDLKEQICNPYYEKDPPAGENLGNAYNEESVWAVFFTHLLADSAGLVEGGPGRKWRLTSQGDEFLRLDPLSQFSRLLTGWWFKMDWLTACPYDIFEDGLPAHFQAVLLSQLKDTPVGRPTEFEAFCDRLIEGVGWYWEKPESGADHVHQILMNAIQSIAIRPLEGFGILATHTEPIPELRGFSKLVSFTTTPFGGMVLDAIT